MEERLQKRRHWQTNLEQLIALIRVIWMQAANLYVIAVSDEAVAEVASQLIVHNKLVVHTAGSVSKDVLKQASRNYGVLYPLQSLRKEMKDLPLTPY
jgi:predicted short-subunit dehydrogenase-like oxidoreductase (DUF2520 family)